ncbi:carbohydrate deacetylase [Aggregatilinea lenta]|uniref:carbohydrate deacetylase n=1 Tax=Aggregatilinea lenta TaxID=913108 RepID=UPI000E5B123E|nr:ChbG/HpnK family deacetylase [Aggregatilinea lenta]
MKKLIVNADDFGLTAEISRGIVEGHLKGIITSTTVMINFPAADAGIRQAQADAPNLGLGLHLNLVEGAPVLPPDRVPSLVDANGQFYAFNAWPGVVEQFAPDEIEAEMRAQFDRFVSIAGHTPDHLDSHYHATYLIPSALRTMLAMAAEHGLPMRNVGLDLIHARMDRLIRQHVAVAGPDVVDTIRSILEAHPASRFPAALEIRFTGPHATLGDLLVILSTLPDDSVTELLTHPGHGGEIPDERRENELAHLTQRATRELVQDEGIELVTFADVARQSSVNGAQNG